jgi:hypothetical protein
MATMAAPLLICTSCAGTAGTYAAAFVDYPLVEESRTPPRPRRARRTPSASADFASAQGGTFNSAGRILFSRNTSSHTEMLTAIGGFSSVGY